MRPPSLFYSIFHHNINGVLSKEALYSVMVYNKKVSVHYSFSKFYL